MPSGDWPRLAIKVRERRESLGLTQDAGGPSKATWYKIENAIDPPYRTSTLRSIERVLRWAPNSVERVLNGGEPEETWDPLPGTASDLYPLDVPPAVTHQRSILPPEWEERFRTLEREVARLKDELAQERADRLAEQEDRERQLAEASAEREQRAEANQRRRQQRENETA